MVYSKNLCSGEITISKHYYDYNATTDAMQESGNTLFLDGKWIYNDITDALITQNSAFLDANYNLIGSALNLSKEYFDKSKFISTFIITRIVYTNTSANKKFSISSINIDVKPVL
jgi:hypothetical protein